MPIVDGREYRDFSVTQFRALEEPDSYIVEGYATTFDQPYDFGYDGMKEVIERTALDGADMSDVIFLMNHEGQVLARQRNNSLAVMCDDHGLLVRADLGGSQAGRDIYEAIKNGLIDRMSWAFMVDKDGWEYDTDTRTSTVKRIRKVFDVSCVSRPANEETEIKARSYFDGVIESEQQELLQRQSEKEEADKWAAILQMF